MNIRQGAPYNDPTFESLCKDHAIWGTAQAALCAVFWEAAKERDMMPLMPQPAQQESVPERFRLKVTQLCDAVINDDDLPLTKYALRCGRLINEVRDLLAATPRPQGHGWVKCSEDQPREIDVDVKLRDGSVICGCLAQSDGDFYWKGGGSEMFILEHEVVEWRPQPPKEGE